MPEATLLGSLWQIVVVTAVNKSISTSATQKEEGKQSSWELFEDLE